MSNICAKEDSNFNKKLMKNIEEDSNFNKKLMKNIEFSKNCPNFTHSQKIIIFKSIIGTFRLTASTL